MIDKILKYILKLTCGEKRYSSEFDLLTDGLFLSKEENEAFKENQAQIAKLTTRLQELEQLDRIRKLEIQIKCKELELESLKGHTS